MKKQLLIAAVAATMASVSMADISITGNGAVTYTNVDADTGAGSNTFAHDVDFTIVGKNGDTSVSATFATTSESDGTTVTSGLQTENVFMKTSVAGVNIKMGSWTGADTLLSNGTRSDGKFSADTTINGIKLQFEDKNASDASVTVSGSVSGVKVSHEMFQTSTDTSVSGELAGVSIAYRSVDVDGANVGAVTDKTSLEISKEFNGVTLTYANADVAVGGTTVSDAFLGTQSAQNNISGFGLATALAGNDVSVKRITTNATDGAVDVNTTEVVITRALASGATFEATYTDEETQTTLDLELAVKF